MINPTGMTLRDWADSVVLVVPSAWAFGKLLDETQWQDWAVGFVRASGIAQRVLPDPYQFDDWQEWAMRVFPMLEANS